MQKKMIYLEKLFSVLSIIFFLITFISLIINCFVDIAYEIAFIGLFAIIFFVNQFIFIPGSFKINNREYENKKLHYLQFIITVFMLIGLLSSEFLNISDNISLCIFGGLLCLFLTVYSLQNFLYTYHYDKKKKIHVIRRILISIFLSSSFLIVLLYSLVTTFRG